MNILYNDPINKGYPPPPYKKYKTRPIVYSAMAEKATKSSRAYPVNTKHLYYICTMSEQRRGR